MQRLHIFVFVLSCLFNSASMLLSLGALCSAAGAISHPGALLSGEFLAVSYPFRFFRKPGKWYRPALPNDCTAWWLRMRRGSASHSWSQLWFWSVAQECWFLTPGTRSCLGLRCCMPGLELCQWKDLSAFWAGSSPVWLIWRLDNSTSRKSQT